jgi:hypothetical protein
VASTTVDPIAAAITTVVGALAVTPAVTGKKWDPGVAGFDSLLPVGVVGMPELRRTEIDSPESQLGSNDWNITYPVGLYFDLSEASYSQAQAVEVVEAFITAIDANPYLGGTVSDAKVTEARPEEILDQKRSLLAYRCRVEVQKLV